MFSKGTITGRLVANFFISITIIFILMTGSTSANTPNSSTISIRIPDYNMRWCGGSINDSGSLVDFDYYGVRDFTLSIANFDSEAHIVEEISIIMTGQSEINNSGFSVTETFSNQGILPVTLLINQYFTWNITTIGCTITIAIQLKVDGLVIDYGVISQGDRGFLTQLLTTWPNAYFYTDTSSTPLPLMVYLGIFSILVFSIAKKSKRKFREI